MSEEKIDIEIKDGASDLTDSIPHYVPKNSYSSDTALIHSEELNYLNENWSSWAFQSEITSHRRVVGPIIVKIKKFFITSIWNFVLRDYFERERNFQMNLVKHLNNSAKYVDERVEKIFWQLVEKVDQDIKGLNDRVDKLHFLSQGESASFEGNVSQELSELKFQIGAIKGRVDSINALTGDGESASSGSEVISPLAIRETIPASWKSSLVELNQTITQVNSALNRGLK